MKLFIMTILFIISIITNVNARECGIRPMSAKPILPNGCRDIVEQCVCQSFNNCYWTWVCVPY